MAKEEAGFFAAIHLGSEQISMKIVEYHSIKNSRVIDYVTRQIPLGEETFKTGKISFGTVREVCEVLRGFRRLLTEYGVRYYRLIATTAIREAENQHYIVDQIKIKTGFNVEVVDMPQEIFYKYISSYHTVAGAGSVNTDDSMLFVDISSGGLGITLLDHHRIEYQQNLHVGTLRIKESFDVGQRQSSHFHQALEEYIYSAMESVKQVLSKHRIRYLVLSGTETRLMLKILGRSCPAGDVASVSLSDFRELYEQVKRLNLPQLMKRFALEESVAEMVLPTIVLYEQIISLIDIDHLIIPCDHFMDGIILLTIAENTQDSWLKTIQQQIFSLIDSVGKKYQYHAEHAQAVEEASLYLFDRISRVHGLGRRERDLLQAAARLHDIGKFISLRRHYFYSYRLIVSTDLLGFSEQEKRIIASVALYHSKAIPSNGDSYYADLPPSEKVVVSKLSAIIRLADAMDRSHKQKATSYSAQLRGEELIIKVDINGDYSLEEWTFSDKADLFEDVYGIKPVLERKAK